MSIRKKSTEKKAPKVRKNKEPKAPKTKKKSAGEESISFDNASFDTPVAIPSKPKRKAPKDVYTLILLLSFLFFIVASVLLYMDLASYK